MATPMLAISLQYVQEPSNADGEVGWEDAPATSAGLTEAHRKKLEAEIQHAKSIGRYETDGDEDLYSEPTLHRAVAFLKTHMDWVWRARGTLAPVPTIGPGPAGSIDLYWRTSQWKLLVNIPANESELATFYGDDYDRQRTKGSFDPEALSIPIIAWLMA